MPEKTKNIAEQTEYQEIMFECKFCGESKPLSEMRLMRQYFPQMVACKECSRSPKTETQTEEQTTE